MDRIQLKELTKQQLKGNWKVPVLLTLAYLAISIIASMFQEEASSFITTVIMFLVVWAISTWATVGIPNFYLEFLKKDGKAEFKDVLVSKNKLLKALGLTAILGIISFIVIFVTTSVITVTIIAAIFSYNSINIGSIIAIILTVLLLVAYIIFTYMVVQAPYIIIENEGIGLIEAMKLSAKIMKGNKWKYFVLQLSFIGWAILSIITLGIGFLWLIPYVTLASTNFYKNLTVE